MGRLMRDPHSSNNIADKANKYQFEEITFTFYRQISPTVLSARYNLKSIRLASALI